MRLGLLSQIGRKNYRLAGLDQTDLGRSGCVAGAGSGFSTTTRSMTRVLVLVGPKWSPTTNPPYEIQSRSATPPEIAIRLTHVHRSGSTTRSLRGRHSPRND